MSAIRAPQPQVPAVAGSLWSLLAAWAALALAGCDPDPSSAVDGTTAGRLGADAGEPMFREVAKATGLDFRHFIGATGAFYFPETAGAGVALLDYDGDGDLDVYLLQGGVLEPGKGPPDALFAPPSRHWPGNRLYRNEWVPSGELRFSDVTEQAGVAGRGYGMGAATGDIDNDGDVDLYVTGYGPNVLYRNNGDGTFSDITAGSGTDDPRWNTSAAFLDYDRDGDLDLFVAAYVAFNVSFNKRCAGLTGERDYCGPLSFAPLVDRLFRNDGGGRFTNVTAAAGLGSAFGSGLGVTAADFNGDGWTDIYVANDQRPNQLWMNRGDGTFEDAALMAGAAYNDRGEAEASMGVTAGDFDADGDEDLFMTHLSGQTNTLYVNDGTGNFSDTSLQTRLGPASLRFTGFGTEWFDFDNDGDLDLFVANGAVLIQPERAPRSAFPYEERNQLFRNEGGGRFTDISDRAGAALALVEVSRGAAFGDIDNDGDLDIVVANCNGPARLMLNATGSRNHWLQVRLVGRESNRDGIGARVAVLRAGRAAMWRRVHTDGSYLSASDARVHFGLGKHAAVDTLVVRWPSGRTEMWTDIEADSLRVLVEGSGRR